jgi:hypothetical protein
MTQRTPTWLDHSARDVLPSIIAGPRMAPRPRTGPGSDAGSHEQSWAKQAIADVFAACGDPRKLPDELVDGRIQPELGTGGGDAVRAERHRDDHDLADQLVGRVPERLA